jgi:uncharacterized protein YdbL (DUF1318 family)
MKAARWMGASLASTASLVALSACVTINVYFPAAEAKEAAKEFVEKVIGDDAIPADTTPTKPKGDGGMASLLQRIDPLSLIGIGSAYAQSQPDISIKTPAIQAIQARMASRFDATLRKGFDAGALGFGRDGLVVLREPAQLELKDRAAMQAAVADDNRDRKAVYHEVAVANGHPEWEAQIREVFAKQWVDSARGGWWYQDKGGSWKQK